MRFPSLYRKLFYENIPKFPTRFLHPKRAYKYFAIKFTSSNVYNNVYVRWRIEEHVETEWVDNEIRRARKRPAEMVGRLTTTVQIQCADGLIGRDSQSSVFDIFFAGSAFCPAARALSELTHSRYLLFVLKLSTHLRSN